MSNREIMKLTNKLIDALEQCDDESLVECVEDAIIKQDRFSDVLIENWPPNEEDIDEANNYTYVVFHRCAEDGSSYLAVEFPAVPGCVGSGEQVAEAINSAKENLRAHLDYLRREGLPIPQSDKGNKTIL